MRHIGGAGLLDREPELQRVRKALSGASAGIGALLIIEGDSGIGKTKLLSAAGQLARDQGACVFTARGGELEQDLPFGVVRELFGKMAHPDSDGHTAPLTGAAKLAEPALAGIPERDSDSFSIMHGLYWLTAGLTADGPAVLVVDDAHLCDLPSLHFLSYLARRIESLPVIVLLSVLRDHQGEAQESLTRLASEPLSEVLRLRELEQSAVRTLIESELDHPMEPEFGEACWKATRGNPFLVHALAKELARRTVRPVADAAPLIEAMAPPTVELSIRHKLGRLPAAAASLVRAAAILGDRAEIHLAASMASIPRSRATKFADALVKVGLFTPERKLAFVHPVVRSVVYSGMGPGALANAHRMAADLLIEAGEPNEAIVPHLMAGEARSDSRAVDILIEQARCARARGTPEMAARFLKRAMEEPPPRDRRAEILMQLGEAEAAAGLPGAVAHLQSSVDEATDPLRRAQACLALARVLLIEGRLGDTVAACGRGLREVGDGSLELAVELEAIRFAASRHELSIRPVMTKEPFRRTTKLTTGTRAEAMLLANVAMDEAYNLGSRERVIELAEAALARDWLFQPDALTTLPTALFALTVSGRVQQARRLWDDAITLHRQRGEVRAYAIAATFRAHTAYLLGDLSAALADARSGLDLAREHSMALIEPYAITFLVRALIDSGDTDAAEEELVDHANRETTAESRMTSTLYSARGHLRLAQGRLDDAVCDLQECERSLGAWGWRNPWIIPFVTPLAEALNRLGQRDLARTYAEFGVRTARQWGTPGAVGEALRVAGLISKDSSGVEQLQQATALAATAGSPLEQARVLTSLGTTLRRSGRPREAREPLRQALEHASSCGGQLIRRQANDELVASGAQPRRLRTKGVDALTPTERRVTAMVADGMTNRAVAQALFVTEKTIETHLAHAYRKLGITSRSQLTTFLSLEGMTKGNPHA